MIAMRATHVSASGAACIGIHAPARYRRRHGCRQRKAQWIADGFTAARRHRFLAEQGLRAWHLPKVASR
ncbi:hypothetical protein Y887_05850 [Xanthomonas pisi DSM 18956]|uniref:Uncharacterized protein n=1 Tax=Xanthomonas pisi TaxID=56457 RepID=A0A2S7D467_9XANT|nr:hypothetical protein Y887_05850 [Xanthomonas pisi DSM 18956]PPU68635.1 hypothetical protein XpiCFBP4643_09035 [Xanthomonas pisi]